MKLFEIKDEINDSSVGVLIFYEKKRDIIIELRENLDEWTAPLLFMNFAKRKIFTIPRDISLLWVRERIIPSGRQNIGSILSRHKLKEYDEMKLLELSEGKCSQDSLYIKKTDNLPEYVINRNKRNIKECIFEADHRLIIFFNDSITKIVDLSEKNEYERIIMNDSLYKSGMVGTGGYFITFNDSYDISSIDLYEMGVDIPVSLQDFLEFVKNSIVDTSETCDILKCSRQNISYLNKQNMLNVVKEDVKGNLYLKGEVMSNMW